mmetsp:Transcript_3005/g.9496  ORF Transcript_3005/g.9496 Transcript_3005/m.9496 type:complete len:218 (-) Transcript_3005:537-1190(-)
MSYVNQNTVNHDPRHVTRTENRVASDHRSVSSMRVTPATGVPLPQFGHTHIKTSERRHAPPLLHQSAHAKPRALMQTRLDWVWPVVGLALVVPRASLEGGVGRGSEGLRVPYCLMRYCFGTPSTSKVTSVFVSSDHGSYAPGLPGCPCRTAATTGFGARTAGATAAAGALAASAASRVARYSAYGDAGAASTGAGAGATRSAASTASGGESREARYS